MQPRGFAGLDNDTFCDLKMIMRRTAHNRKGRRNDPAYACAVPEEITLQLTHRCNLRCNHCFQWSRDGHHHRAEATDLRVDAVQRICQDTHQTRPAVYLWGGEPLVYPEWETVTGILAGSPRRIVISTNGLLLEQRMDSLLRLSHDMVVIISIDGLEEQHDALRGPGTFRRLDHNVRQISRLRRQGQYHGRIVLNCSLSVGLIAVLEEFVEYCESLDCDRLVIGFPWYIPAETVSRMDRYFAEHLAWLTPFARHYAPSWHSFQYHIDATFAETLREQIARVQSRPWRMRIGFHPAARTEEIEDILKAARRPINARQHCLGLSHRVSVFADGGVSFCANFPEFCVGSIYEDSMLRIWRGPRMARIREIRNLRPMPVEACQRCRLLSHNPQ